MYMAFDTHIQKDSDFGKIKYKQIHSQLLDTQVRQTLPLRHIKIYRKPIIE